MSAVRIAGIGTSLPPHRYTQDEVLAVLRRMWADKLDNPLALDRFHHRVGVDQRYFVLPIEQYEHLSSWGEANRIWLKSAEELGERAINSALQHAGLAKEKISALLTVSVTGIASPSLDAHLVNRMNLPFHLRRTPIFGLGCVAGAAGLAQAADYVRAYPDRTAVLLSVELCSLTWQRDDLSIANLISSGLFGDGAAAVIVSTGSGGPEIIDSVSEFFPATEEVMGWDISEEGFRIVLSPQVPEVIHKFLPAGVDNFLARHDLRRSDIGSWAMHTGGPKVLSAMIESLGLTNDDCAASWDSLRAVGNLSSASVLFVLEDIMRNRRPAPGTWGLLAAMGPGFCSELILLRW